MGIKTEVKVFLVEKQCEVCNKGTNCDNTEYYTKQYPHQILEKTIKTWQKYTK